MPVVETLSRLVEFPSVSDRPVTGIGAYIAERCEAEGFRVERLDAPGEGKLNLVCSRGPAGTDGLVLSGHMDVVPVDGQPWSVDPFRVTERGGRLLGRGTADMKGFIAATIEALPRLPRLERELVLVFTCDEEVGCLGSRDLVTKLSGRPLPSLCLIGEPTSFKTFRMHPGHAAMRLWCTGRAAHSSKPDLGDNAIGKAARAIAALEALAERWRGEVRFADMLERPFVVMNVARIEGGSAINIVPDRCAIDLGFRALPGMDEMRLAAEVGAAVAPWATAELVRVTPALLTEPGTALEQLLAPFSQGAGAAPFATDGGNLAKLGMRSLVFGPGSIDVAHRADEFVPADQLHRAVDIVTEVVARRCG
ncbi:MAG: acetylornithine deacetylase [Deltaproteobacteria bacterium]|nr:acetylornithine deacetylase [Deltaproteobacteria bacterium]